MFLKFPTFLFYYPLFVVIIYHNLNLVCAIEAEKELTITNKELVLLNMLSERVMDIPTEPRFKSKLAILRWLRAKNLNIDEAEAAFKANLKWRQDNSIDSILDEDWSFFKDEYFFDESGTDFSGRPVISADISAWDVRQAVVAGKSYQLVRYMIRGLEIASRRVNEMQEMGRNVTQWQVILNMDNFSLIQHGCLSCLSVYIQFLTAHETYYPFGADKIIILNTPAIFEVVLRAVRPLVSPQFKDSMMVFGANKNEWRKAVLSLVPQDQLARQFGGTKVSY